MTFSYRLSTVLFTVGTFAACTEAAPPSVSSSDEALTAAQCMFFQDGGRTTICHATGSARNPIVQITVATAACVNAHADHAGDFVAVDGSCGPGACLAEESPCDATLPCCDGLACGASGRCGPPPRTCVTERFTQLGCDFDVPGGTPVFGGLGTVARTIGSNPLASYVPRDENCELSFGACTTFADELTTTSPILISVDAGSQMTFRFGRVIDSFTVGQLFGPGTYTVRLLRGGAVVASTVIDRFDGTCVVGSDGAWAVEGGFDTVVIDGNAHFGVTDLEACYTETGGR